MSKKKKTTKKRAAAKKPKKSSAPEALSNPPRGSSVVPRESVGAACQAAVSFENASSVSAVATDATRTSYTVSWS